MIIAAARPIAVAAVLLGVSGCLNRATTQLPTLRAQPQPVERQSQGHFDPFPAPDLGPDTFSRPPDFTTPRTQERQTLEGQYLRGAPAGPVGPGFSNGAYRDGDVVR